MSFCLYRTELLYYDPKANFSRSLFLYYVSDSLAANYIINMLTYLRE